MGMIAGLEVGLPGTESAIDAAWMQSVLRTSGGIDDATSVASIDVSRFEGGGLLSILFRCALSYSGGEGPATVMVKFPMDVPHQRGIADAFCAYAKEVAWYRDIAPRSKVRIPKVHAAMIAEDQSHYCLVLEDLGHLRQASRTEGTTWDEAMAAIDALAAYHSSWTGSSELEDLRELFFGLDGPVYSVAVPGLFQAGWPIAKQHGAHLLSPDLVAFGDDWVELMPKMMNHLSQDPTLCHYDWRADNMFFDDDGDVIIIDPQLVGVANPAYDLGYFISQSVEREVHGGRLNELTQRYVDQSASHGVELDADRISFDARVTIAFCLIYCVGSFPSFDQVDDAGRDVILHFMRRIAAAIDDFDAIAAVRSL